ncbi:MAG: UDPglucose--hexose-phosphate uridylyltransferase [Epulopiscium sp.]|jgi:UDPglucose--hexose-1-phosphate uridylyltransferase|nr:galactose-phosphate uridylyltransferase [Defluviitaleaceae bacterium]MDK2789272.1 UDPglucose--hexose-phosphate uridylyltransferase [Candidatus Epulonipiscium sp.]
MLDFTTDRGRSMSEIRKDIVTGVWTIIAVERGKRPHDFEKQSIKKNSEGCPFCAGNENQTPPEVLAYRTGQQEPNNSKWKVRVVPNKYSALKEQNAVETIKGFYETITGYGVHEVLIDTTDHEATIGKMSYEQLELVLRALKERYKDISSDDKIKYVQIFKNQGAEAGASLQHPHWQIIGVPLMPENQKQIIKGSKKYFQEHSRCVYCEMLRYERNAKVRIIYENKYFTLFAPYASRFCYETWIMPKQHLYDFSRLKDEHLKSLAQILKESIQRYEKVFDQLAYNICFMSPPLEANVEKYFHWHIQIIPRLGNLAGFELSTGSYINPTPPEMVAETLQKVAKKVR